MTSRQCKDMVSQFSRKAPRGDERGVSMIELLFVVVTLVIMTAVTAPSVIRQLRGYHLSSTARDVSTMIQRTRYEALRRNTKTPFKLQWSNNIQYFWIDVNNDGNMAGTEAQSMSLKDVDLLPASSVPAVTSMGFSGSVSVNPSPLTFNAHGMPDNSGGTVLPQIYFFGVPGLATYGFRAVSVTPAGKVKVWQSVSGGTWKPI